MPAPFVLEEVTLSQTTSLDSLYALYCQNFPLPDEQESYANFLRCLKLNDDTAVQKKYGPYHEYYLTIRQYDEATEVHDTIVGGLIFGVCSSPAHTANGYLCSVQVIYLFRTASEALRRFLYAGKAMLEAEIEERARAACRLPRFREVVGADPGGRVAMFFEVNNPGLMSPEEIWIDRDLSHVHPARRYVMWMNNHTRPLAFRYVQPPLSTDQEPARYLDLFAVNAPSEQADGRARLSVGPDGERGVPGPVLAEHLRCFFRISVLKGDAEAMKQPCLPPPLPAADDAALLTADQYCDTLTGMAFVPLLAERDPSLRGIRLRAMELSVSTTRMLIPPSVVPPPAHWLRATLPRTKRWMELVAPFLATGLLAVAAIGELLNRFLAWKFRIPWLEEMELLDHVVEGCLAAIILWYGWRAFRKGREQRRADRSPTALGITLEVIQRNVPAYHNSRQITILRDVLSDRAARHLRARILLGSADPASSDGEISAVSRFIAARTLTPYLADLRLSGFNRAVDREADLIERALRLYPTGAMQSMYRMTPWQAYYTCVFPVVPRVLEGEGTYTRLMDFDRWVDGEIVAILGHDDAEREHRLTAFHEAGGETCLFVSHILDLPWDESDPGSPPEFLFQAAGQSAARQPTTLEEVIGPWWTSGAEVACGRMLAVVAHLAVVMRLMARHGKITTGMFCRCTVVIHVTAQPSIHLLRSLGFDEIPIPAGETEAETSNALGGALLSGRIEPGAFAELLTHGAGASAAFFGLIDEVARGIRDV